MATIKVFDCNGVKELNCFDTLDNVPYITGFEDGTELLPDFDIDTEENI